MYDPHEGLKIVVDGPCGAGRSAFVVQFVNGIFVEKYDPTIEDSYRKQIEVFGKAKGVMLQVHSRLLRIQAYAELHWLLILIPMDRADKQEIYTEMDSNLADMRRLRKMPSDALLPCSVVASKCDLISLFPNARTQILTYAARIGARSYYECSGKFGTNVSLCFRDVAQMILTKGGGDADAKGIQAELGKFSGVNAVLPWNWAKKAKWNTAKKHLEFPLHASHVPIESLPNEKQIAEFRFPEPSLERSPVACTSLSASCLILQVNFAVYDDLRKLMETSEGNAMCDVTLITDDCRSHPAHRAVLSLRCAPLRNPLIKDTRNPKLAIEGISSEVLEAVLYWIYTDRLPSELSNEISQAKGSELQDAARHLGLDDLLKDLDVRMLRRKGERSLDSSDALQALAKPVVQMSAFKELADVEFLVGKEVFKLHRCLISARSDWFRALMAQYKSSERIVVKNIISPVFACIVEYLYTGRVKVPDAIAIELLIAADMLNLTRLVQLTEFALHELLDDGNAVPIYLAAEAYGAKQLSASCVYWMSVNLVGAEKNEQWHELPAELQASVRREHARLLSERVRLKAEREVLMKMPCCLAPAAFRTQVPAYRQGAYGD